MNKIRIIAVLSLLVVVMGSCKDENDAILGICPEVISTDPANLETGVDLGTNITITFNEAMNPATITPDVFTLNAETNTAGTVAVITGVLSYNAATNSIIFNPTNDLPVNSVFTARVEPWVKDMMGNALQEPYIWTFTTSFGAPPTIVSTTPADLATNVALNSNITALFSQTMDGSTLTNTSFTVKLGADTVPGSVSTVDATATFNPDNNLLSGETYTATIRNTVKNMNGASLVNEYVWNFNTAAPLGPGNVILNTVAEYGIFAGVGIRNDAGFSEIRDMNVGITPGVRSSVTGFPPAIVVNGAIHASDDATPTGIAQILSDAKQDLVDAYLFAEGATFPAPQTANVDQGGLTLAPGIYKASTSLLIQNGDLTLDAQGDANAVWIFQIGSALTTVGGAGGNIVLTGGAQAKNVYWQVGSSATIGDNTIFKGNVLALSDITMNSGAVAEGRMLARNGTVVMTSTNIITRP